MRLVFAGFDQQSLNARGLGTHKRGAHALRVTLLESADAVESPPYDILDLDDALTRLSEFDERKATIIEQQYFGGLRLAGIAELLGVSLRTVEREARLARAWLQSQLCN